ncbi:MAG: hypothetical protein IKN04_08735 [Clostridia bacterium]|nr:hypothetical protein [Clostridia bacterium]
MKIKMLKTGEIVEHESGYAARLIEQGKAVPAPPEPVEEKPAKGKPTKKK